MVGIHCLLLRLVRGTARARRYTRGNNESENVSHRTSTSADGQLLEHHHRIGGRICLSGQSDREYDGQVSHLNIACG